MEPLTSSVGEHSAELGLREELSQLSGLNTGLARYIQTVRQLTRHNNKLVRIVNTLDLSTATENQKIHTLCKEQIENMRKEKERIEKNLSQMKTETDVLLMLNQDLKSRNCKMDKDLIDKEKIRKDLSTQKQKLQRSLEEGSLKKESSEKVLKETEEKSAFMQIQLEEVDSKVSDIHNENEKLQKNLLFKRTSIEEQRTQITETKQIIKDMEKEKLNPVVRNLIGSWHDTTENDEPVKGRPNDDHEEVWSQLSSLRQDENYKLSQVKENEHEAEILESKIQKLKEEHENLLKMIKDMNKASDSMKILHEKKLTSKDEEIDQLLEKLKKVEGEVEELLMIKQGLDAEIKIYKTLIDSEEGGRTDVKSSEAGTSMKTEVGPSQPSPCFTFVTNETPDSVRFWCH